MKKTEEYEKFDRTMHELIRVPHSEIKAKLEAEKRPKKEKTNKRDARDERDPLNSKTLPTGPTTK
jgi:hypothetical protein